MDEEGKKPAYVKPVRKKKPEDEVMRKFNELMRDETFRRKLETSKRVDLYKIARRLCNKHVRRKEKEMAHAAAVKKNSCEPK